MQRRDLPDEEKVGMYRQTFSTRAGRATLVDMLDELMVFSHMDSTAEDVALKNYGLRLLAILGGGGISAENMDALTIRLMKQPIIKTIKEK